MRGNAKYATHQNLTFNTTLNMREFLHAVRYDPSSDPRDPDFKFSTMAEFHKKSQAEFKTAKLANRNLYKDYLLEGLRGERGIHIPPVNAWMDEYSFIDTVFVNYHNSQDGVYYGKLYVPLTYMMQSDGQTQTAAVFLLGKDEEAVNELGALENLRLSIEIELNCDLNVARQSFADRNGRGVKKNKNLVIEMDVSAPLNILRLEASKGTIFENRIIGSGAGSISDSSTSGIMNLSTAEQVLIHMLYATQDKGLSIKHHHIDAILPHANKFFKIMEHCFKDHFPKHTALNDDPFRKKYLTGWAHVQKAIANAFHYANLEELGPLVDAIKADKPSFNFEDLGLSDTQLKALNPQERFQLIVKHYRCTREYKNVITQDELIFRLKSINWYRHATHWIDLLGATVDKKTNKPRTWKLRYLNDRAVVKGARPHNLQKIGSISNKILGEDWEQFTSDEISNY
ncbi:hypothetical protein [Vibrio superstes]|uniref:hypothetical protein n=1 Tax=Vibrio superstes TaxID=198815 RepID=UPI0011BD892D|nr:hypothetical protein [Vibrio superstes]